MTNYTPTKSAGLDTSTGHFATQVSGLVAGEPINRGAAVEIRADGRLYNASGAGAVMGVSTRTVAVKGQGLTVRGLGQIFRAADGGLTPGKTYYAAANGQFGDVATAIDAQGMFAAIDATDLCVVRIGKLA